MKLNTSNNSKKNTATEDKKQGSWVKKMVLHEQQAYVLKIAADRGIALQIKEFEYATNTCFEKAELLGWPATRVVKTVFFAYEFKVYGFVFPELGTKECPLYLDTKELFPTLLEISKKQAKSFKNSYCPEGMEHGTCTPFVLETSFDKGLEKLFIHDLKDLESTIVDISIGGVGPEYHKKSMHLTYDSIYQILSTQFGEKKIRKADLFASKKSPYFHF